MEVGIYLEELIGRAKRDEELRGRILATGQCPQPLAAFCAICREQGFPLWEMDLIGAGEEFYAAIKRSTNGGGENSPELAGEDDFYSWVMAELKG